jgi:N-acetylneuraminic acid mutarotase
MTDRVSRRDLLRHGAGPAGAALTTGMMSPLLARIRGVGADLADPVGPVRDAVAEAAQSALGRWSPRAPLPFARTEVSVATLGRKMYLLGGYAQGRADQPFNQEYDPAADRWRDLASMPRGLNHVGVVGANGRIYTFGGFIQQNRNAISDAFEYDAAADRWRTIRPLPAKRGAMSVVELDGRLHLVGGRDETSVGAPRHLRPHHRFLDPARPTARRT